MPDTSKHADALCWFGCSGDLGHKMTFPALYAMAKRGHLTVPIIGVAYSGWTLDDLKDRARDSIEKFGGGITDTKALDHLIDSLHYVDGDYDDPATFTELKRQLDAAGVTTPAHYLAIPPSLFGTVIESLGNCGAADNARVIVEKPFGRDLASAIELNRIVHTVFPESSRLPDRPLPREGGGAEHPLLPLRQLVPRADLEPQLHQQRADHDGGGLRRAGPRRVLRGGRRASRTSSRTTSSRSSRCSRWSRRREWGDKALRDAKERVFAAVDKLEPSDLVRGPVRGLPQRARVSRPTRTSRPTPRCGCTSTRGVGPACRGSCGRARSCPST